MTDPMAPLYAAAKTALATAGEPLSVAASTRRGWLAILANDWTLFLDTAGRRRFAGALTPNALAACDAIAIENGSTP